jgi:hypothetical protein
MPECAGNRWAGSPYGGARKRDGEAYGQQTGRGEGMATNPLPPDEKERWLQRNVAKLRQAVSEPETQKRLLALLNGDQLGEDDEDS